MLLLRPRAFDLLAGAQTASCRWGSREAAGRRQQANASIKIDATTEQSLSRACIVGLKVALRSNQRRGVCASTGSAPLLSFTGLILRKSHLPKIKNCLEETCS